MRIGLDRAEIVDADDFDILAAAFGDGAQDVAADAAEPVNGNTNCHGQNLLVPGVVAAGAAIPCVEAYSADLGGMPGGAPGLTEKLRSRITFGGKNSTRAAFLRQFAFNSCP